MYSKTGEIRRDETCLDYSGQDVILYPCHGSQGNQLWNYDPDVSQLSIFMSLIRFIICRVKLILGLICFRRSFSSMEAAKNV